MGRARRPRPTRLAAKLFQIRRTLNLTQEQMLQRLDYKSSYLHLAHISGFELDKREPPLLLLLQYARVYGVPLEVLVDDELDLPEKTLTSQGGDSSEDEIIN
jgi:transcriptional regulator with XRE-family HTH domain